MKHHILLIDPTIQPNGVEYLNEHAQVFLAPDGQTETLIQWMNDHAVEAVLTRCEVIGKEIMDAVPTLKVVGQHGVGLDNIGKAVAQRAQAVGMHVMAFDGFVPRADMEALDIEKIDALDQGLSKADFVTLHVPLTPDTQGMMSTHQFAAMKKSACLINMGRGPVVDEAALVAALQAGEIAGAGLDVLEVEPPRPDHPLFQLDQVLFTPHIGGDTREAKRRTSEILSRTVLEALDGQAPYNWVNRPKEP